MKKLEELTRKELIEEYRRLNIPFRSGATKRELVAGLKESEKRAWKNAIGVGQLEPQSKYIDRLRKYGIIK